jgi:hypothetical protein
MTIAQWHAVHVPEILNSSDHHWPVARGEPADGEVDLIWQVWRSIEGFMC